MTTNATLASRMPSKQQVRRTASEFAVSLAIELLVLGLVRRVRRGRRSDRGQQDQHHEHALLHAMLAEAKAEGATELSTKRRRLLWQLERKLDEQMEAARHHG